MAKKKPQKIVVCRYPKCKLIHESTELLRDDAVQGGKQKYFYHPDCLHIMQTINEIRDLFIKNINPSITGSQIGQLVSVVNNMVFKKKILPTYTESVDYIKFALEWIIKNKPNVLKYPAGMHYIVQDRDVETAWKKEQEAKIRADVKNQMASYQSNQVNNGEFDIDELLLKDKYQYKPQNKSRFSNVLGV